MAGRFDVASQLEAILACVCSSLDDAVTDAPVVLGPDNCALKFNGCPDRACVVAGVPDVTSCECGELVVFWTRRWPVGAAGFPSEGVTADCPPSLLGVDVAIRLARCACSSGSSGQPPSCDCTRKLAYQLDLDASAVLSALKCCLGENDETWQFVDQVTFGPQGGCIGTLTRIRLAVELCC